MIAEGRVRVNGKTLSSPAFNVTEADKIDVDGKPLRRAETTRLWLYHKPRGLVTTHRDEQGRPTIFQELPRGMPRVVSVGRLDLNSEGLLLLTNDGELSRKLELPATGFARQYRVRAFGRITEAKLEKLAEGVTVDGMRYGAIDAYIEKQQGSNVWLVMTLHEGKNKEIRRVLEYLGLQVNRLIRTSYGPFSLGTLAQNETEEVPRPVLESFIKELMSAASAD
jgi:23S rRNA pseudouridine2605 synthase